MKSNCAFQACLGIGAMLAITMSAGTAYADTSYSFSVLEGQARAINDSGQIVGFTRTPKGIEQPVLWDSGNTILLPVLGPAGGVASAINDLGEIAGYTTLPNGTFVATKWVGGQALPLSAIGGQGSVANAINNAGDVAGYSYTGNGTDYHATVWSNGKLQDVDSDQLNLSEIHAMNGPGLAVGSLSTRAGQVQAVYWQNGQEIVLPSLGGNSYVMAINDSGQMAGFASSYAVVWKDGVLSTLGTLAGYQTYLVGGINIQGQVVGEAFVGNNTHALSWTNGQAIDLNDLLPSQVAKEGWVLNTATGINRAGQIIGLATNALTGVSQGYVLSPVPEPSTWALMALGCAGVGLTSRRRAKNGGLAPRV